MKKIAFAYLIVFLGGVCSCSSTHILSSWAANHGGKKYKNMMVFVAGKNNDEVFQQNLENQMARYLKKENIHTIPAHEFFAVKGINPRNEAEALEIAGKNGFDGLMMISLVDKSEEQSYGAEFTEHTRNSEDRWNLHTPVIYNRSSDETDFAVATNFVLKVKLYDIVANTVKYSVQAKTYEAGPSPNITDDFSKTVIKDLRRKEILSK